MPKQFIKNITDLKDCGVFNDWPNKGHSLSTEQGSIKTLIDEIEAVKPTDSSRVYQEIRVQYEADSQAVTDAAIGFIAACKGMNAALADKKGKLTEPVAVVSLAVLQEKAKAFTDAIYKLNQSIVGHNRKYDNFQAAVEEAKGKIINHYSASHYANYKASLDTLDSIDKKIVPLKESVSKLEEEETSLDAQLSEHDIAVDRINELLASFLGRSDIKLITHDKGYYIEREGERAKHLSEGEKTAIAFTYFISKMEEKEFDIENSVIVVDDPISSLDTNALYAAGAFIRCHLEKANQVFVLTHNYYFFREIFGWIRGIKDPKKGDWHENVPYKGYIMLKCEVNAAGKRKSTPYKLDETLKNYDSEYLFLFKQLYEAHGTVIFKDDATPEEISKLTLLPNVARRVLETFILFKFPDTANGSTINLYNKIKPLGATVPAEKVSILDRLLNRASHGSEDGMTSINMFNLAETPKVIEYVLDFIEQADPLHYAGLKRAMGVKEKDKKSNDNQQGKEDAA